MKSNFKEDSFINLNQRERNSVFFLIGFLVLSILLYILSFYIIPTSIYQIKETITDTLVNNDENDPVLEGNTSLATHRISRHTFNPNNTTPDELISLGIPQKAASNWIKYIEKGGRFKNENDLKKIYGLSDNLLEDLLPYAQFKDTSPDSISSKNKTVIPIDVNTANYKSLVSIGLSSSVANTLLNYRSTGATFLKADDLKKIYGMNDSLLATIRPYLLFPSVSVTNAPIKVEPKKAELNIYLNTADTNQLKLLEGIGSKLAGRIVKYRDQLGGFHSKDQLKEIYQLPDSTIQKISKQLIVSGDITKIKIHTVNWSKLYHPYIDKKQAFIIKNFIEQHKPIQRIEDLYKIEAFDKSFWQKLEPYLDYSLE